MSISSLLTLGTIGQGGERTPVIQPVLSNRFRCTFFNFGDPGDTAPYDLTRAIKSVQRPKRTMEKADLHSYLSIVKVATRAAWDDITITFHEDIDNQVITKIHQQWSKQQNMFDMTAARAGENYKFEIEIDLLAGGATAGAGVQPNVLQKCSLAGCFITSDELGQLQYSEAAPTELSITISLDNCTYYDHDGRQLGSFDHAVEIDSRSGLSSTGVGNTI